MSPWPPELLKPEPVSDAEWDRLAAKYVTPVPSPLERWAQRQREPWTPEQAMRAMHHRFVSPLEAQDAIEQLVSSGVLERVGHDTYRTVTTPTNLPRTGPHPQEGSR